MKIFDKFTLSDKRDELVIRYYDEAMSTGKMHTVYALSDIRSGKLRWEDVEADFADFTEFSRVQIKNVFLLNKRKSKELSLKGLRKS